MSLLCTPDYFSTNNDGASTSTPVHQAKQHGPIIGPWRGERSMCELVIRFDSRVVEFSLNH